MTTRARTPIDRVACQVVSRTIAESPLSQGEVARRFGIDRITLYRRLRRGYSWSLGELVMLSTWLGQDLLRLISDEVNARRKKAAS